MRWLPSFSAEFAHCVRVWPHHYDTEGAFVAHLSKRAPTPSPKDAPAWDASATDPAAAESRRAIEGRWSGTLPCPPDQIFTLSNRHLCRQPSLGPAIQEHLPYFVRSGMRVARHHKEYYYLSQQTVALWGHLMQGPSVELNWPQLQDLFAGRPIHCDPPTGLKGEIFCRFGPWTVCRAIAREGGRLLEGMLPRALYRAIWIASVRGSYRAGPGQGGKSWCSTRSMLQTRPAIKSPKSSKVCGF